MSQDEPQQPPPVELPHTPMNPNDQKLVVIGGGISGITTAYYLQKMGRDVLVVESLDDVAQGASKVAVPILKRYQSPIINFELIDKRKSQYCPVRMFYRAQQFADSFTHKAFFRAYGFDVFKSMVDNATVSRNLEKLTLLTQSNYSETLNLMNEEKYNVPISIGHLFVGDDKSAQTAKKDELRRFKMLYKDCDMFELKHDDPAMLFPALQQEGTEMYGGMYTPSTMLFHPTIFAKFLHNKILQNNNTTLSSPSNPSNPSQQRLGKVDFMFNTKAVGFTMKEGNGAIGSILLQHQEAVPETPEEIAVRELIQTERHRKLEEFKTENSAELKDQTLPGVNAGELSEKPKRFRPVSTSEVAVDKVVLCNGYQAFQITEHLHQDGPLLQVIPVRSLTFDVYDKTRARFSNNLPSLFPTYPATFFPEDPEFTRVQTEWERRRRELGIENEHPLYGHGRVDPVTHPLLAPPKVDPLSPEEVEFAWTQKEPMNLHGVSSVEFGRNGLTLVQDLYNPRHFTGYMGKDMAQIGEDLTDRHLQSVMSVLESIRKIPEGALQAPNYDQELLQRRLNSRKTRGGRYLSMQPNTMGMHTVGRDGLPVIGPTPYVSNLYFNTGHGTAPQNTAVIGAKLVASIITDPRYGEYADAVDQNTLLSRMTKVDDANGRVVFNTKPTKFDLDRLYNLRPQTNIKEQKINPLAPQPNPQAKTVKSANAAAQQGVDDKESPSIVGETPSYLPNFNDFSPTRWPLHKFSPIWFEDAGTNNREVKTQEREAAQRRELKRQQIAERLAQREKAQEQNH